MSKYYNPHRTRNCFDPQSSKPFRLSRSKINLFLNCPRCFYMDRRLGVAQPPGYPFSLNSAVDKLLKKEFDAYRMAGRAHPLMEQFGIDAIPFAHEKMNEWRNALHKGITHLHEATNLLVTGAVDDIWVKPNGELIVVDYKATSKEVEVTLDEDWQIGYRRQMEFYQWLLHKNGFFVSPTGYFVYCNGDSNRDEFNGQLHFDIKIIPYEGNGAWIEPTLLDIKKCLISSKLPVSSQDCDVCRYRKALYTLEKDQKVRHFNNDKECYKPKIIHKVVDDDDEEEEEDYRPKTIKEAVKRFIELWDNEDIELLNECPKNRLDFLCANLEREVIERCELNESNPDLLDACGSRDMKPKDASRVIIKALWEDCHTNG